MLEKSVMSSLDGTISIVLYIDEASTLWNRTTSVKRNFQAIKLILQIIFQTEIFIETWKNSQVCYGSH